MVANEKVSLLQKGSRKDLQEEMSKLSGEHCAKIEELELAHEKKVNSLRQQSEIKMQEADDKIQELLCELQSKESHFSQ